MIVTIDGVNGSGKSSLANKLCENGYNLIDSSLHYRAIAYLYFVLDCDLEKVLQNVNRLSFNGKDAYLDQNKILVDLQQEDIGELASKIAVDPSIRNIAKSFHLASVKNSAVNIAPGRDMGSIIFPDAKLKIYLTIKPEKAAQRRYNQLKIAGFNVSLELIIRQMQERLDRDMQRTHAPLTIPNNAVVIDTSEITLDELVIKVENLIKQLRTT